MQLLSAAPDDAFASDVLQPHLLVCGCPVAPRMPIGSDKDCSSDIQLYLT